MITRVTAGETHFKSGVNGPFARPGPSVAGEWSGDSEGGSGGLILTFFKVFCWAEKWPGHCPGHCTFTLYNIS